jgi:predicted ABC-type ATPase
MPTLTVVAGANGAGKSTLTRLGREGFQEYAVLDPDAIARSLLMIAERPGSVIDAGRVVLQKVEKLLTSRDSFLVETTLSGKTSLRMMARAKAAGYFVVLLYVGTDDVAINIDRVKRRVYLGGHDIPETDQLRRYPRSAANFRRAFLLADEVLVFDNSTPLGHVRLAEKNSGGTTVLKSLPWWAAFLAD